MIPTDKEMHEFEVYIHARTAKAILASLGKDDGDDAKFWLPLSQIEIKNSNAEKGESTIVEIPQWLVENNKLLDSSTEDSTVKATDVIIVKLIWMILN